MVFQGDRGLFERDLRGTGGIPMVTPVRRNYAGDRAIFGATIAGVRENGAIADADAVRKGGRHERISV